MDNEKISDVTVADTAPAPYKLLQGYSRAALRPRHVVWQSDGLCNRCNKSLLLTPSGKPIKGRDLNVTMIKYHPECRRARHNHGKASQR